MTEPTLEAMRQNGAAAAWLWRERRAEHAHDTGAVPIAVLLIGDGRDALMLATMRSFLANVTGYCLHHVVQVDDRAHAFGFDGAIREGWAQLQQAMPGSFRYVFHLEEDWEFTQPVDVRDLATILGADQTLAQVALRRGPVNETERRAGGFAEMWPSEYEHLRALGVPYLRHRLGFTTNPSLYRRELTERRWPDAPHSEATFGTELRTEGKAFAFYGPWGAAGVALRHTGDDQRNGHRY